MPKESLYFCYICIFYILLCINLGNGTVNWLLRGSCNYEERCHVADAKNLKSMPWNYYLEGGYPEPFLHGDM